MSDGASVRWIVRASHAVTGALCEEQGPIDDLRTALKLADLLRLKWSVSVIVRVLGRAGAASIVEMER